MLLKEYNLFQNTKTNLILLVVMQHIVKWLHLLQELHLQIMHYGYTTIIITSLTETIININISLIQLKHMSLAMLYLFLKRQSNNTFKDMVFKMRVLVHVII